MVKKQLIMEKALELFAKQGFEATSIQQITERCGISKGAFYLSFKSKDELIIALIDHFMMEITADIDHLVKTVNKDQLLYEFYYKCYHNFHQHSDFARLLIKEQTQTLNKELIGKLHDYTQRQEKVILLLIEKVYGDRVKHLKYDLVFCIKSFLGMYGEFVLFKDIGLDFDRLARSLVEKTNLIAEQMTTPFITEEHLPILHFVKNKTLSKEQIIEVIANKMEEMEESIEKESLALLKDNLKNPTHSPAIVHGLVENIRKHPHCKWIAYLIENYYGF